MFQLGTATGIHLRATSNKVHYRWSSLHKPEELMQAHRIGSCRRELIEMVFHPMFSPGVPRQVPRVQFCDWECRHQRLQPLLVPLWALGAAHEKRRAVGCRPRIFQCKAALNPFLMAPLLSPILSCHTHPAYRRPPCSCFSRRWTHIQRPGQPLFEHSLTCEISRSGRSTASVPSTTSTPETVSTSSTVMPAGMRSTVSASVSSAPAPTMLSS